LFVFGHNFLTANASLPIKVSKDLYYSVVSSQYFESNSSILQLEPRAR